MTASNTLQGRIGISAFIPNYQPKHEIDSSSKIQTFKTGSKRPQAIRFPLSSMRSPQFSVCQDVINRASAREVSYTSFNQRRQKICQIGDSLKNIHDHMWDGEVYCIYPRVQDKADIVTTSLLPRLKSLASEGFAFVSKSFATASNIACSRFSASLQDVLLLIPHRPPCFFSVLEDDTDQQAQQQTLKNVVALSRGIVQNMRRFSDLQFSLVYGIITKKELSSDKTFNEALERLADETSQWSVPVTLTMSKEKHSKIVEAFILSISIIQCLSNYGDDPLWCLTPGQFKIIQEKLHEKKVTVKVMPHCGQSVLMLEVAARLDKTRLTILVSEDDKLRATAQKQRTCTFVMSHDEYVKRKREFTNVSIVTDCGIEASDLDETVWTFVRGQGQESQAEKSPRTGVKRRYREEEEETLGAEKREIGPDRKLRSSMPRYELRKKPDKHNGYKTAVKSA